MKNRNEFYAMDRRDAYRFIWECINHWCDVYGNQTARIEDHVTTLVNNWNANNLLGERIDWYEYADPDFLDNLTVGLGIEDEYFIFPEYREQWDEYMEHIIG